MLERAAVFVSAVMLFERTLSDAESREQSDLFDDLMAARVRDPRLIEARASRYGLSLDAANVVLVFAVDPARRYDALEIVRGSVGDAAGIVAMHRGYVCAAVGGGASGAGSGARAGAGSGAGAGGGSRAGSEGSALAEVIRARLRDRGCASLVGIGRRGDGLAGLPRAHDEAHQIVEAQRALGRHDGVADLAALGVAGMMLSGTEPHVVEDLIRRHLGPVLDYDRDHGTQLCLTAWTFLEAGSSAMAAGTRLFLHKNTVRQRLDRLGSLIGEDWRTPPRSIDIHFALRLWRLRSAGSVG